MLVSIIDFFADRKQIQQEQIEIHDERHEREAQVGGAPNAGVNARRRQADQEPGQKMIF